MSADKIRQLNEARRATLRQSLEGAVMTLAKIEGDLENFDQDIKMQGLKLDTWNGHLKDMSQATRDIVEELKAGRTERLELIKVATGAGQSQAKSSTNLLWIVLALLGLMMLVDKVASSGTKIKGNTLGSSLEIEGSK